MGVPRSTGGRVLDRYRIPLQAHVDYATGLPVRRRRAVRYELSRPGGLVHVEIKKLGRIPHGGGHRIVGRQQGNKYNDGPDRGGRGHAFLHCAVDDFRRLAYSEQLPNERKETAARSWRRAEAFFAEAGFTVEAVMTDNCSCYRSGDFAEALGPNKRP